MPTENEKKALDLLHNLPEAKQLEALDFIEFLWQKSVPAAERIQSSRERILYKADKLKGPGGPKLDGRTGRLARTAKRLEQH